MEFSGCRRDKRKVRARVVADRHRDAGCERPVQHGLSLLSFQNPRRSDSGLPCEVRRAGQGRASGERSERSLDATERFGRIATSERRGGGGGVTPPPPPPRVG